MTGKKSLLQRARIDLVLAGENIQKTDDELYLDIAAYHLQQGVEKLLKYQIEHYGEVYRKTHDIGLLWGDAEELGLNPPEWVWVNRVQLNRYQSETRYGDSIVASRREIREFLVLAEQYSEQVLNETTRHGDEHGVHEIL